MKPVAQVMRAVRAHEGVPGQLWASLAAAYKYGVGCVVFGNIVVLGS